MAGSDGRNRFSQQNVEGGTPFILASDRQKLTGASEKWAESSCVILTVGFDWRWHVVVFHCVDSVAASSELHVTHQLCSHSDSFGAAEATRNSTDWLPSPGLRVNRTSVWTSGQRSSRANTVARAPLDTVRACVRGLNGQFGSMCAMQWS